jgi:hypothetical protein
MCRVTRFRFSCSQDCEFFVFVIPSPVNWGSSVNRMSGWICSLSYSSSQNFTQLIWSSGKRCSTLCSCDTDRNHRGIKFSIPVSVYTIRPGNSAYTRATLYFCQNFTFFTSLFRFCSRSLEGTSAYVLKSFAKCISLPLFHNSRSNMSIAETLHEMHVGISNLHF